LNTILDVPTDISLSWKSPEDSLLVAKNDPLYAIVSDFYFYNYAFCKEQRFSDQQTSTLLSILKRVIDADMNDATSTIDSSHNRFMHLLMKECVDRSPHSMQIFTTEQGEAIIKYVIESYYRHFNLYHFNFTRKVTTVIQQKDTNGVDEVKLPRNLAVSQEQPDTPAANMEEEQPVVEGEEPDSDGDDDEWARASNNDAKDVKDSEAAGSSMEAIRAKRAGKIKGQKFEWQWKWACSRQISWVSFLPEVGNKLEKAYKAGAADETVSLGGGTFRTCDFKRMVCINVAANRAVDIRRAESEEGKRREIMREAKLHCHIDVVPVALRAAADAKAAAERAHKAWRNVYRRRVMNSAGMKWFFVLRRIRKKLEIIQMENIQKRVLELMADQAPRVGVDLIKGTVSMSEALGFVGGKAILLAESHPLMNEINFAMSCIKQTVDEFHVPFLNFRVEGHTSVAKKSKDGGKATSTARAHAVMDEIVSAGIPAENLFFFGFGDTKPISTDKDKNRRVEITVMPATVVVKDDGGDGGTFRRMSQAEPVDWWDLPTPGYPTNPLPFSELVLDMGPDE
jgi:flagellar motor protein MotB